jgi:uncharacterized protein YecE (DUF72 family)
VGLPFSRCPKGRACNCALGKTILKYVACEIRIGTSGWHYRHWVGPFYPKDLPAKQMFTFYQRHFDTVELNNSFYRLPTPEAFDAWRESSPSGFVFAVKGSRFVTHNKKLKEPEQPLKNLLPRAERLREKLGPVLWQLPPKWQRNVERLEEFLQALPRRHRYAFEFRESSWHHESIYEILRRYNAAYCIYELAGFSTEAHVTADFAYVRLHGPGGKYQGSYSEQILKEWSSRIVEWSGRLKAVYVYFDNDQAAYAAQNALELKRFVYASCGSKEGVSRAA